MAGAQSGGSVQSAPTVRRYKLLRCAVPPVGGTAQRDSLLSRDGWRGLDGTAALRPRHSIGTGYFTAYAQDIDGEVYPFGFAEPGFDDGDWLPCMDRGLLTAGFSEGEDLIPAPAGCDPVSRFAYEMPPRVLRLGEGHYLADLGQEIVGTVALDVPGSAAWRADALHGAEVRLYMGEQLCPEPVTDGTLVKWNMNTGNRYRLAWRLTPGRRFTTTDLMTFRFVELIGLPFELTPAMLRGVTVRRASCGEGSHMDCDSPCFVTSAADAQHGRAYDAGPLCGLPIT